MGEKLGEKWWRVRRVEQGKSVERVRVTSNAGTAVSHSLGIRGTSDWGISIRLYSLIDRFLVKDSLRPRSTLELHEDTNKSQPPLIRCAAPATSYCQG